MEKPSRKTGVAHFFAAASYSAGGLRRLARESAFRQEAGLGLASLLGLWFLGATAGELVIFAGLLLLLVAVEALNTALEVLVDHLSPGWSQFAKDAKDLGSLAVACVVGTMVLCAAWALLN
ncbi:MAG: diacylglycerol kinase [Paracoccaceae bacterium]